MTTPSLIYFSSVTENTKIFVEQLPFRSTRLPLRASDELVTAYEPYILVLPTYGGGRDEALVPKQVMRFLSDSENRRLCVGVIGGGNINFGEKFAAAADLLASKLRVPVLARFEVRGTITEIETITRGVSENWQKLVEMRGLQDA